MARIPPAIRLFPLPALVLLGMAGCIDNTVDPELAEVDFLVGSWEAVEMAMISQEDPQRTVDLMATFDATFTFDVEPSGRYTATLRLGEDTGQQETGSLEVEGDSLLFTPDDAAPYQSHFETAEDGQLLIIEGSAEFDFDGDLDPDPAILHLELRFL